jgi:endoglucanase
MVSNQFGIMNEPHDLVSISDWADTVQSAVNSIRAAGAASQYILMPGSQYCSAAALPTEAGPLLAKVTDPANNGTSKLLFDGEYFVYSPKSNNTNAYCAPSSPVPR